MEEIQRDELNQVSMNVILCAGDARELTVKALDAMEKNDYELAEKLLKKSKKELTKAHKFQTGMLQKEAEGYKIPYTILFNHAQDTLMTIQSEHLIAKHLITMLKSLKQ